MKKISIFIFIALSIVILVIYSIRIYQTPDFLNQMFVEKNEEKKLFD